MMNNGKYDIDNEGTGRTGSLQYAESLASIGPEPPRDNVLSGVPKGLVLTD